MFKGSGTSPPSSSVYMVTLPVTEIEVGAMLPLSPGHDTIKPTLLTLLTVSMRVTWPERDVVSDHEDTSSRKGVTWRNFVMLKARKKRVEKMKRKKEVQILCVCACE